MKCNACNMENMEGAIFCEECGAQLEGEAQAGAGIATDSEQLVLKAVSGENFEVPDKEEVVIGREDPVSEVFPDVDLSGLDGMEKGVSRKHAIIHRSTAGYTLEDLESTNGTYVNKKRIKAHEPQTIKPGDEVRFGKLVLTVQAA